ncbi:MAG: hypothetical protein AMXMBFR64_30590 [Myxococcales bacterium]
MDPTLEWRNGAAHCGRVRVRREIDEAPEVSGAKAGVVRGGGALGLR